jgi:putative ABC transport system permease protein
MMRGRGCSGTRKPVEIGAPPTARLRVAGTLVGVHSVRALARNPLRTALAGIGIAIGIAAVVWCIGIGQAGTARAEEQFANLGDNLVWVEAGSRNINGVRNGTHGTTSLTLEDADAIRREVPLIARVTPNVDGRVQVAYGNRNWNTHYRGIGPDYFSIKRWPIAEGAPMTEEEVTDGAAVCWLGETVRAELFGSDPAIGQTLRVEQIPCLVVGVLAPKGQSGNGQDQDDTILLPYSTAQHRIRGRGMTWVDDILCSAVSPEAVNPAIDAVQALIRQRHQIGGPEDDDFNIRRPDEVMKAQIQASQTLELLLVTLASIALLVGGIGIMNVMLASVSQRTREIGVRLAIGATPSEVKLQFLGEAVVLAIAGGTAGVALSAAGAPLFQKALGWEISISLPAAVLAVTVAAAVGIISGFLPARRAAALDPIDALRHE